MNGITGWRMQANEPQCLSALLTQPEEGVLVLTRAQALQLLETRREALRREGLVEWGEGILPQLAKQFAHSAYLDRLELEQEFLHLFPESLAVRTLLRFDPDYRRQFYNLSGVLLRCVLVTALRQEITGVRTASSAVCLAAWRKTTAPAQQEAKLELLLQQLTAGRCPHPQAVCRYLAPELHGFVQQLAVTRQEGLGHLAVCME